MLVGSSRQPERDGRRDREDLATLGLYQLPSALVDHPVMSGAQEDEVFQLVPAAVHHVGEVVTVRHGRCSSRGDLSSWAESFAGSAATTSRTSATIGFIFDFPSPRPGLTPLSRLRPDRAVTPELPELPELRCRRDPIPRPCQALQRCPLRLTKRSLRQTWLRGERHPGELTFHHARMALFSFSCSMVRRARFELAVSWSQTEPDGLPNLTRIHLASGVR